MSERYTVNNFEVHYAAAKAFGAVNTNVLCRVRNSLVHLINRHASLPKFIVIFLEADLIQYINCNGIGATCALGESLDWLVAEFRKTIIGFKDIMPLKAKIIDEPHIVWIHTTRHVNYADDENRHKFNKCLEVVIKLQENSSLYDLRQLWNDKNNNLVLPHNGRLTYEGLKTIWAGLDRTIKYAVVKYQNSIDKAKIAVFMQQRSLQKSLLNRRSSDERAQDDDNRSRNRNRERAEGGRTGNRDVKPEHRRSRSGSRDRSRSYHYERERQRYHHERNFDTYHRPRYSAHESIFDRLGRRDKNVREGLKLPLPPPRRH